jgi:hypothetical protein
MRTPAQLLTEIPLMGLDEERSNVTMTVLNSDDDADIAYLLLRPERAWPVVVVPTARETAHRMTVAFEDESGEIQFTSVDPPAFFLDRAIMRDIVRVLADFEAKPLPSELMEVEPSSTHPPPDVETLVEEAARVWHAYQNEPVGSPYSDVVAAFERVLDSPLLEETPLNRRLEILEDLANCFYQTSDATGDETLLRRCIEVRRRLLATMQPGHPDRSRQLQLTGYCMLRLWASTGEAADRIAALELLSEGGADLSRLG